MSTREGLHSKVYALVPLQIVVPIEALLALVAFEWAFSRRLLLLRMLLVMVMGGAVQVLYAAWTRTES